MYFGWSGNVELLRQWATQEWGTGSLSNAVWYPSQSLGGILHAYFGKTDYSRWPDSNYPDVQILSVNPNIVRGVWIAVIVTCYAGLLWVARVGAVSVSWIEDALAFATLPLLLPFAHRIVFVVLLWPAMVVAALLLPRNAFSARSKYFLYTAITIFALEPFVPGSRTQRFFQVAGLDFWATCLLSAGLLLAWLDRTLSRGFPVAGGRAMHNAQSM